MPATPLGSHGNYEPLTFSVPASVAEAARKGLELRERFGDAAYKRRTTVGAARAKQLSSGSPRVTLRDIVYINSYFSRHAVDLKKPLDPNHPSNGWMSWLLWGGTPGQRWAHSIYSKYVKKGVRSNPTKQSSLATARETFLTLAKNGYGDYDDRYSDGWTRGFMIEASRRLNNVPGNWIQVFMSVQHAPELGREVLRKLRGHRIRGPHVYMVSFTHPKNLSRIPGTVMTTAQKYVYIGSSLDVAVQTYIALYDKWIAPANQRWPRLYNRMKT